VTYSSALRQIARASYSERVNHAMIFRQRFLEGIRDGSITLAFRRWRRPSVRAGGTLMTAVGQLEITSVAEVATTGISNAEARRAGYASRDDLLTELSGRTEGTVYRVELGALRPDPRVALRESATLADTERREISRRLQRLDSRAPDGAWTRRTLEIIRDHPGRRAGDLSQLVGVDKLPFKLNVRKLKALGLTESLEIGYRLSPRGLVFMKGELR
jgi:hypothetical protein